MTNNCYYLDAILIQYYQGKDNSLSYRIARRNAHSSDGELASLISNMSSEPKSYQASQEVAFQLLCLNHTLLSYISALGVHRSKIEDENVLTLLNDTVCYIDSALRRKTPPVKEFKQPHVELIERINLLPNADNPRIQLVLTQIRLLLDLLPQIINCIQIIEQSESKTCLNLSLLLTLFSLISISILEKITVIAFLFYWKDNSLYQSNNSILS
ncbi:hypothetical protein PROPEN_04565 [Proteus penneri ATCC 35198]|nr:hypothetical protein PROPEN_04565 [Proteus penneri ATCC 35198]